MISKQLFPVYKYLVFPVQWPQSKRPLPISNSCHLCSVLLLLSIVTLIILFISPQKAETLPPPFHLVAIFMKCFLCIFWVTRYIFPPTYFLCTTWFPQAIPYFTSLNFRIASILNVFELILRSLRLPYALTQPLDMPWVYTFKGQKGILGYLV